MGSGQSSAGNKDTDSKGTFSIDSDAKGEQPKPAKKNTKRKKKRNATNDRLGADSSQEVKMVETSQQQRTGSAAVGLAPMAALSETPSSVPQLVTLNNMPRVQLRNDGDNFSLLELDAILDRMKAKYRPRPVVLSGKSHGLFEEYEQNLVDCYSKHKDQPLECSKVSREYNAFVTEQRNRILREVAKKDSRLLI